jgi:N-glycosylase/DNA lyase
MTNRSDIKSLLEEYGKKKPAIKARLKDFRLAGKADDEELFHELCFCLLTPQSKAVHCDLAIKELKKAGLILKGQAHAIRPKLKGRARFHNKKAVYIVGARNAMKTLGSVDVRSKLNAADVMATRQWLVDNIKGLGYKEASHFLRNIGLGKDIAILDRHILKNLKIYGAIDKIPSTIGSRKTYLALEEKVRDFSKNIGIPVEELDLLFWSMETGHIFK